jgi:hypothetical protein
MTVRPFNNLIQQKLCCEIEICCEFSPAVLRYPACYTPQKDNKYPVYPALP